MQNENVNSADREITNAVTGSTRKAQGNPIVPTTVARLAIQGAKSIHGLKSDHETVDALLFAVLGFLPVKNDGESEAEAGDRLATLLAQSPAMRAGVAAVEGARKLRKAAEKVEKSRLEAIAAAEEYRLAQVAAGVKTLEDSAE
jgi:hypothetical protein